MFYSGAKYKWNCRSCFQSQRLLSYWSWREHTNLTHFFRSTRAFARSTCHSLVGLLNIYNNTKKIYIFALKLTWINTTYCNIPYIDVSFRPVPDSTSRAHNAKPANVEGMLSLAAQMAAAALKPFTFGVAYTLNDYTADGTVFDYMAGSRKVCVLALLF